MKNYLLLTGATGFIGQYLLRRFLCHQIPTVVIVRRKLRFVGQRSHYVDCQRL